MLKQISIAAVFVCCAYGSTFAQLLNPADHNTSTQTQLGSDINFTPEPEAKEDIISTIIDWSADLDNVTVSPNPTSDVAVLQYDSPSQTDVSIRLYTSQGSFIRVNYYSAGLSSYSVSLGDLTTGSYYAEVLRDGLRRTCKIVVSQ